MAFADFSLAERCSEPARSSSGRSRQASYSGVCLTGVCQELAAFQLLALVFLRTGLGSAFMLLHSMDASWFFSTGCHSDMRNLIEGSILAADDLRP
jgi:hypothetical protein